MPPSSRRAAVQRIEDLSPTVRAYHLRVEGKEPFSHQPGQWISLLVPFSGGPVERVYSIASAPGPESKFELCVKQGPGEPGDQYLGKLTHGETVGFTGPGGTFVLREPIEREAFFVANGTGIAPMRAMLQAALKASNGYRLTLLLGARSEPDLLYHDEWKALESGHENFRYLATLSRPSESWPGHRGRVPGQTAALIKGRSDVEVYICGQSDMVTQVRRQCQEWGVPEERVHNENYG